MIWHERLPLYQELKVMCIHMKFKNKFTSSNFLKNYYKITKEFSNKLLENVLVVAGYHCLNKYSSLQFPGKTFNKF